MTRVLITGGCGFIGANLTEFLLDHTDWHINILDNLSVGSLDSIESLKEFTNRIYFFKGDITNLEDVGKAIEGCSYVVNLAAQTGVKPSLKNPFLDLEVNILGTLNLLKNSVDNKIKKFIQASSSAVLGDQKMPLKEEMFPRPNSPYGASKLSGENYCRIFSNTYNLNSNVLRFSNVYGKKAHAKNSIIPKFIKRIILNEVLEIYGDGNQTRDFIYVEDICNGIYLSLIKETQKFELIQLGTGMETSVNSLVRIFEELVKEYSLDIPDVVFKEPLPGEVFRSYADISKANKILGFSIQNDLEKGLRKSFAWFLDNKEIFLS
jgi:UDP-glucose 4-epimerase